MNKFQKRIVEGEDLFQLYKFNCKSKETLSYLNIIEGEFVNYYSINCRSSLLKFTLRFIKSLFLKPKFSLYFSDCGEIDYISYVNTSDYIFNDNLAPLLNRLEEKNNKTSIISLNKNEFSFFKKRNSFKSFPIKKILSNRTILFSINNIVLTFYIYLIALPDLVFLINQIKKNKLKLGRLIISADPCDIFSRALFHVAKEEKIKYFLLQIGPIQKDTPEWKSIMCNVILCWKESELFFRQYSKNYITFFPPRFFYTLENNFFRERTYELVVFLPWVHNNKEGKKFIDTIQNIINYLIESNSNGVYVKYHPANKIKLKNNTNKLNIFPDNKNNIEILRRAKKVINFGSTLSYDCSLLNIPCGIINMTNHLPDDSPLLNLKNIFIIKSISQLSDFVDHDYISENKKIGDFSIVDFIHNQFKNHN